MKVFVEPEAWLSRSIHRVAKALTTHAPKGVEIVDKRRRADLEVLHVVGRGGITDLDRPFAAIMYCVRTTETPSTAAWLPLWSSARLVFSYYDLHALAEADGVSLDGVVTYRSPLGVDANVFKPRDVARDLAIGTSGFVAETESVSEVAAAARLVKGQHFHLGPRENVPGADLYAHDVTDEELATWWSRCRYVSGLRRQEGFELPAYEGLLCGARPIVFDAPHYTAWLGESARYVPEVEPEELALRIAEIIARDPEPVSEVEREHFVELLDWGRIAGEFWERVL